MRRGRWTAVAIAAALAVWAPPGAAQEIPKPSTGKAQVHQIGLVRVTTDTAKLLDLPGFVHRSQAAHRPPHNWLDFSALYFLPPNMMHGHLEFNVTMGSFNPVAWYPYAADVNSSATQWRDVQVGVQADGLETTHPVWMMPRAMELASTVKVYKPGPPGTKPDDPGTTEGDVYMFLRGDAGALDFIGVERNRDEWIFDKCHSIWSDFQYPLNESNSHAWLMEGAGDDVICRPVMLDAATSGCTALTTPGWVDDGSTGVLRNRSEILGRLNEAMAGSGLRSDEAMALAELVMESTARAKGPVCVYLCRPEWIDRRLGLTIEGPAEKPVRVFAVVKDLPE